MTDKTYCSCGNPQSYPIPHIHDLSEREKQIYDALQAEIECLMMIVEDLVMARNEFGDCPNSDPAWMAALGIVGKDYHKNKQTEQRWKLYREASDRGKKFLEEEGD